LRFIVFSVSQKPWLARGFVSRAANACLHCNHWLLNLSWWPQQNIDVALQYSDYVRFHAAGTNYDGAGRDANGTILFTF
jgi:hypothetical protein